MVQRYFLPAAAVAALLFAIYQVVTAQQQKPKAEPFVQPARMPYGKGVAGSGLVEPETENISVGAYVPGIVTRVNVKVGQQVRSGDLLFELDDRQLQSELLARQANLKAAQAQLARLEKQPRTEELPPSEAKLHEAEANLFDQQDQLRRAETLFSQKVIGEEELIRRRQAERVAQAQHEYAQASYLLLKAGAWTPDLEVARASVAQMASQVVQTETDLKRLKITAVMPRDVSTLDVLQVNVRPGEYVGTPPGQALVVLGNVTRLHVRVDIDEHDIPRFSKEQAAVAKLRGDPRQEFRLRFVRVEPYVIPKKSLTGDNTERVDTRVLQVIYAIEKPSGQLYVGQQLDVFVEEVKD